VGAWQISAKAALLATAVAALPLAPNFLPAQATTEPTSAPAAIDPAVVLRRPNSSQAERDEAARRLVLRQTPEAREALATALKDINNPQAQLAAARAIPLDPNPDANYVLPLFALISNEQVMTSRTEAAIQALASFRAAPDVRRRLIDLAIDPQREQRVTTRAVAVRAVGTMSDKRAARALIDIVSNEAEPPLIRDAAASALADMTGQGTNRRDPAQWQRWWAVNQGKGDAEFEHDLLEARSARLTRLQNRLDRMVGETQTILTELYQASSEKSKEAILLRYLRAAEAETRAIGAEIVQIDFKQTRPIPPSVRDQLRAMVGDSSSQVRVAVAKALFLLNDATAFDALLEQLAREDDADVRMELAKALVPMRDVQVVPALLKLLRDPSLAVAETAALGLGDNNLAPLIQKDPQLSARVAAELRDTLEKRTGGPGTVGLRAAIIDAMGALKSTTLQDVYKRMLRPGEAVLVRRATLRAVGQLGKPNGETWPANLIVDSLPDPDDGVRKEAVSALKLTADFNNAERLYELVKPQSTERNPEIREEAWGVLRNLFDDPSATTPALLQFAERFRNEPERRIEVFQVLARRLTAQGDNAALAGVRLNIGEQLMKLSAAASARGDEPEVIRNAEAADKYFDLALQYYREKLKGPQDMTISGLLEQRMGALLISKRFDDAALFAASSIATDAANLEPMGRMIRNEVQRLGAISPPDALRLIAATNKMKPGLAEPYATTIRTMEQDIRRKLNTTAPRSAVGSEQ
jgi:HEAT repeat protein